MSQTKMVAIISIFFKYSNNGDKAVLLICDSIDEYWFEFVLAIFGSVNILV